jgi:uncharacterized transporter YbjL
MQILGAGSFFMCVLTMLVLFIKLETLGEVIFGISLVLLLASLGFSLRELQVSIDALNYRLSDIESLSK